MVKDPEVERRKCPHCGGENVRRSQMRGLVERMLRLTGYRAYRCERCDKRYYGFRWRHQVGREKRD